MLAYDKVKFYFCLCKVAKQRKEKIMIVDAREILFIRQNAPQGMLRTLANNTGIEYSRVRAEMYSLKEEYDELIVKEARRLLEANTGMVYNPETSAA